MDFPILFQVPGVAKGRRAQGEVMLRNKQLCSSCREISKVQPTTFTIPDNMKRSFQNYMDHRMSPHQSQVLMSDFPYNDTPTENIHYKLPLVGSRIAVFHELLLEAYRTLQETQPLPRKESKGKTMKH
uniref:uncharacterized protein C1orf105 homolog n=1 Tax=Jaculus jaculus TaxID=51337 RepID=UPI001E1B357C|nr:uncharacterized protein C1orf105 homolog [Jaculus jaculus]